MGVGFGFLWYQTARGNLFTYHFLHQLPAEQEAI
jgi:hypothetical protein